MKQGESVAENSERRRVAGESCRLPRQLRASSAILCRRTPMRRARLPVRDLDLDSSRAPESRSRVHCRRHRETEHEASP
jgi:hypothetical protein